MPSSDHRIRCKAQGVKKADALGRAAYEKVMDKDASLPFAAQTTRCRAAQQAWAELPVRDRLRPIRALRHLLVRDRLRLCAALESDVGKSLRDGLAGDLVPLAEECRFLDRFASKILQPRGVPLRQRPFIFWGQRDTVHRRPRGVVGVIGTWNFPIMIGGIQIIQALVAGNGVLFKPSELAPRSSTALAELIAEAGFPEGLFHCLPATREAGPQLAEADIDHVVFTGGSTTGQTLAAALGRRLISSTLELSGCDPMFLLEDGDAALAARGAWFAATANDGQLCMATRRVFVPRRRLQEFMAVLTPLVEKAAPTPAVMPAQVDHAAQVIDDASQRGATLIRRVDGAAPPGYVQPAVLLNVSPEARLCQEAIFAPLLGVVPYDRLDDAVASNEKCPFGLSASIFSGDRRQAEDLAAKLHCGAVWVNDVIAPLGHPATHYGGRRASGWGATKGREGLLEMTVPQVVSRVGGTARPYYDWNAPFWFTRRDILEAFLELRHAPRLGSRLRAAWRIGVRFLGLGGPDLPHRS